MGKKTAKTPDYKGAAEATAEGNKEAAVLTALINRPNQVTPFGNQTWSLRPGADQNNPTVGDYTVTTTIPAEQQALLDQTNKNSSVYGSLLGQGLTNLGPLLTSAVPGSEGFDAYRDSVASALYDRGSRFAAPRFEREEGQTRDRLTAMGFQEGSEGYGNSLKDFADRKDSYFADLEDRALLGSQQAAQSALQAEIGSRSQQFNELAGLASGAQINSPQFNPYGGAPSFSGPDYSGAAQNQFAANQAQANAHNAGVGNFVSGLVSLGSAALGAPWLGAAAGAALG